MNNQNPVAFGFNGQSKIMEEVMMNGNIPVAAPGRFGMMSGGGGVVPPTMLDESLVPKFYQDAIAACGATQQNMLPHTGLVYNLMVTSGLPRSVLSYVWSAVNRTLPGQLTRPEFFSCLALIALAQKGESLAALSTMSSLPIPYLQLMHIPSHMLSTPIVNVVKATPAPAISKTASQPLNQQPQTSSFIPSSLLPNRKSKSGKKDMDLLGDVFGSDTSSASVIIPPTTTVNSWKPSNDDEYIVQNSKLINGFDNAWNNASSLHSVATLTDSTQLLTSSPSMSLFQSTDISRSPANSVESRTNIVTRATISSSNTNAQEHSGHWHQIIVAAMGIFSTAECLFDRANDEVLHELVKTERGDGYLRCLHHLYLVIERVERSAGHGLSQDDKHQLKECQRIWMKFLPLLKDLEIEEVDSLENKSCAICCQSVSRSVDYGGQSYHSECANLWVNSISSLLPNLHLR